MLEAFIYMCLPFLIKQSGYKIQILYSTQHHDVPGVGGARCLVIVCTQNVILQVHVMHDHHLHEGRTCFHHIEGVYDSIVK